MSHWVTTIFSDNHVHIQQRSYTCGPVSILNILHCKGDFSQTESSLARLCKSAPRTGTTNENLVRAARQAGLRVIQEQSDAAITAIEKHLNAGHFVVVNYLHAYSGEGHYGVVVEHDKKALYLIDSSYGLMRLKKDNFGRVWHNADKTIYGWLVAVT